MPTTPGRSKQNENIISLHVSKHQKNYHWKTPKVETLEQCATVHQDLENLEDLSLYKLENSRKIKLVRISLLSQHLIACYFPIGPSGCKITVEWCRRTLLGEQIYKQLIFRKSPASAETENLTENVMRSAETLCFSQKTN